MMSLGRYYRLYSGRLHSFEAPCGPARPFRKQHIPKWAERRDMAHPFVLGWVDDGVLVYALWIGILVSLPVLVS